MSDDEHAEQVDRAMGMRREILIFFRQNAATQAEMAATLVTTLVTVIAMSDSDEQRRDGVFLACQQIKDGVHKLGAIRDAKRTKQ